MNKLKKFVFIIFAVLILSGCSVSTSKETGAKIVNDDTIKSLLESHIISLQSLPKTLELYVKGSGETKDYTADDKLNLGLEMRFNNAGIPSLTQQQILNLQAKQITNVTGYIPSTDVEDNIKSIFGPVTIEHKNMTGCPTFIYDDTEKIYYINSNCTVEQTSTIISFVDKVTSEDNIYYVTVYAGLIDNNKVYADFNKSEVVKELLTDEQYAISDETKEQFTKITYTFTKNSNGEYVFTSLKI